MNQKIKLFLQNSGAFFTRKAGCLIFTEEEFEQLYINIVNECALFCDNETMTDHMLDKKSKKISSSKIEPIQVGCQKDYFLYMAPAIFDGSGDFEYAVEYVKQLYDGTWELPTLKDLEMIAREYHCREFSENPHGVYWSLDVEDSKNVWTGNFMNGGGMNPILTNKTLKRFIRAVKKFYY